MSISSGSHFRALPKEVRNLRDSAGTRQSAGIEALSSVPPA